MTQRSSQLSIAGLAVMAVALLSPLLILIVVRAQSPAETTGSRPFQMAAVDRSNVPARPPLANDLPDDIEYALVFTQ
jgi:hypothetical protein